MEKCVRTVFQIVCLYRAIILLFTTNISSCWVCSSSHKKWLYFAIWACIKFVNSFFFLFFSLFFNSSNSHELVQGLVLCKQFFTLRMLLMKSRYCAKYHRSLPLFYTVCHHCSSYSIESHLGLWYSSQVFSRGKKKVFIFFLNLSIYNLISMIC